jgi:hypothetical protein
MVDSAVHSWLANLKDAAVQGTAVIVQFAPPKQNVFAGASSRGERIRAMESHVGARLAELTKNTKVPSEAVRVLGAIGQAVIQAPPSILRRLVAPDSPLATAPDVIVRPNTLMPGPRPIEKQKR